MTNYLSNIKQTFKMAITEFPLKHVKIITNHQNQLRSKSMKLNKSRFKLII